MLDPADRLAIHELLNLYGIEAVLQRWRSREDLHPLAHHANNIVVTAGADADTAQVISKGSGVGSEGRDGRGRRGIGSGDGVGGG
jgi:hypothetical protein